jgi:NADPH:quinone reductase-like Zn-dependent oxidoreductase
MVLNVWQLLHRRGYKHVGACGDKLVEVLRSKGADDAVDVDHACLSETIDTIGLYGFRHDFNALGYGLDLS